MISLVVFVSVVPLVVLLAAARLEPAGRGRAVEAAARGLAGRLRQMSAKAVASGRAGAVVFPAGEQDEPLSEAWDADGDGVSRADCERGQDDLGVLFTLGRDQPGTSISRPAWEDIADVPPSSGRLSIEDPAVRFGRSRMVVFDPEGHATPGSLFVSDRRTRLCAVVVHGATARVRTWCYERGEDRWRLL
ncbi:MAG: hypothetical protein JSV80_06495 [Acidobacteriota bacterium]|nr:MAG: hypothetical protein JSV80_06495 [Acidobacteriota bacterium]